MYNVVLNNFFIPLNPIQSEVESVLNCGIDPKSIIFANCCKPNNFIRYAQSVGVDLMTFDNEDELIKIANLFHSARLVLRIKADDSHSTSKLGLKFGVEVSEFEYLLRKAKCLGLNVVGIAFHVGSGCQSTDPYADAIRKARMAFDIGTELGFKMTLLDIGGGFPGSDRTLIRFETIANFVTKQLEKYFGENSNDLTVIAEPGRYYAMSAFDLFTLVTSRKVFNSDMGKECMYYINDGLYGSFSSVVTGNKVVEPIPITKREDIKSRDICWSVIWGPTCDSYDCVRKNFQMPEMFVGEWMCFKDMGSYSLAAASHFNGMPLPRIKVFVSDITKSLLMEMKNWPKIEQLIQITCMASD